MQNKRSKGVTAFGVLFLWFAFIWTYWTVQLYLGYYQPNHLSSLYAVIYMLSAILLILLALFTSIGLFMLKKWARKLALGLGTYHWLYLTISAIKNTYCIRIYNHQIPFYIIVIFSVFCLILIIVPIFLLWWFFTRPKVREQFNGVTSYMKIARNNWEKFVGWSSIINIVVVCCFSSKNSMEYGILYSLGYFSPLIMAGVLFGSITYGVWHVLLERKKKTAQGSLKSKWDGVKNELMIIGFSFVGLIICYVVYGRISAIISKLLK